MATLEDINKVKEYYGSQAKEGTYSIDGRDIQYDGPNSKPSETESASTDRRRTPESWDGPQDARSLTGAGKYPNYYAQKTRSGHVFMMDDSEGAENVTLQHRSGTMIQVGPSGVLNITSHNGQYNIVFGENRMMITGAQDITVQGDSSLRVDGDYNMNVNGKVNINAQGDINFQGKNINTVARGNIDIQAKNRSEQIEGSILQTAIGAQTILSAAGMTIGSRLAGLAILAKTAMSLVSKGTMGMKSDGKMGIKTSDSLGLESAGALNMKSDDTAHLSSSGSFKLGSTGDQLALSGSTVISSTSITLGGSGSAAPVALDGTDFEHSAAPEATPDSTGSLPLQNSMGV